ncbi:hypothetical protein LTR36_007539 [Oleoguttula mirabilis]|uniref:Uncharacterized protein n=1 Tax=Oleoguttula mirabilis TaxID=1507867 RepID=A0AAV9JU74_9PEZI|nr:hypothetical protein LTR36_007539 [Oleoguttula mirabilis]
MNDMLRSPHVSAHLSAQQRSAGLVPMHNRPRSHTAPSTPLVEAPSIEPVELPGSLHKKSVKSLHQSIDGNGVSAMMQSPTHADLGARIVRPHSSPQENVHSPPNYPRQSNGNVSRAANLIRSAQMSPRCKSSSPHRFPNGVGAALASHASDDILVANDQESTASSLKRPSLSVLQRWHSNSPSLPGSYTISQAGSTYSASQLGLPGHGDSTPQPQHIQQADSDAVLMAQISLLRAAHEAHLSSLREAHEREIQSHRSYISFLEKRQGLPQVQSQISKQLLTLDTSHTSSRTAELTSADASATTLQSWGSSLENQKRTSQEAVAEAEALKRKLSLCRKAVAESGDIRRERDHLRDAAERGDRRIVQLKDIVRKAKDHEKSLKNAVTDLEARLVLANNQRTDVLEGFHEACENIRMLTERERDLTREVEDLRAKLLCSSGHATDTTLVLPVMKPSMRPTHTRTTSDVRGLAPGNDPLMQQLREMRQLAATQGDKIRLLEHEASSMQIRDTTTVENNGSVADVFQRFTGLEADLRKQQKMLVAAQADCERYNELLHNELRRQSRYAAHQPHTATPNVEAQALLEATERVRFVMQSNGVPTGGSITELVAAGLERELEHCIQETIQYKLDNRGYKRDLKNAQAQLESLQAMNIQRPLTPDGDCASSIMSNASSEKRQAASPGGNMDRDMSGLGIHLPPPPPQTPTRTLASATSAALMSATPSLPPATLSPPARPQTPLGSHKKLPKPPPSRTPSPLPAQTPSGARLHRGETLRSLSESIISSYAKRGGTPEQGPGLTLPPARERNSEPLRVVGATLSAGPPTSKFVVVD